MVSGHAKARSGTGFMQITILLSVVAFAAGEEKRVDPLAMAARHPIVRERPGPDFFEGALLGNGGLGAVVTTRPDAVVVHFGHNNVWDIRVSEENREKLGTFQEVFKKVKAIPEDARDLESDPWYREYIQMTQENYGKPYPRPFPCGSLLLGFDRWKVELLGYRLDIATGLCRVQLLIDGDAAQLQLFTDMESDQLWIRLTDAENRLVPNCFERVRLIPDPDTPKNLPDYEASGDLERGMLSFRQVLPSLAPGKNASAARVPDRAFRLSVRVNGKLAVGERLNWEGRPERMGALERAIESQAPFVACVQLDEGLAADLDARVEALAMPDEAGFNFASARSQMQWREYWARSGVALDDPFLEQVWYWNHYFFHCAAKAGVNCPGLFANWSYRGIGTAWHGDYHMNYNTQQPFWLPFSSNRVELNLPYVELIERLLPMSKQWAREYYGLRGAYFPHSAYPVEMTMSPYPVPTWGWEICETPWSVQGLWWHYLYTMDKEFLRTRAFTPMREAVLFLVDYMKRPEARGPQWGDDKYHVFPTVPPELYGLRPGFKYNYDCLVDLTLIKFVMKAYLEATRVLEVEDGEAETIRDVRDILAHFPEYPTAESAEGTVFVSVPGERAGVVYNVPNSLMTVFPGEDHGLHSTQGVFEVLANTYRNNQNEGGNDLVFLNLQAARLGLLDLERFKRQVNYCLVENGTCTDMVLQVHGRYSDTTAFDFMRPMGVWFENFGLPVVINECLLQSYNGTIRLFPNWPLERPAAFSTLRAVGAFLVNASCSGGAVERVVILSEVGGTLRVVNPWKTGARVFTPAGEVTNREPLIAIDTLPGETVTLLPSP
ncbi:MAG: glycoside hydrolase N-terminal domain-containing protein [Candidatus Hydrogenedentes bacterium]|nr:glycoside hydrolase N-terminal domain-containing protein [Candidatus Hydrogenedentota bacterium]